MTYKLAIIGIGTVGCGLLEILVSKKDMLKQKYDADYIVTAISDLYRGSVYAPEGLDIAAILKHLDDGNNLNDFSAEANGWDAIQTIQQSGADILVEASFTDAETGEPATTHIREAFAEGMHVVTTNKGPLLHAYDELKEMAQSKNLNFGFEGAVLSGTPVFGLIDSCLQGNSLTSIKGILNGTTNYILCEMEKGLDYETALKQAQDAGYAEAVPDMDVDGTDAQTKAIILANVVMGKKLTADDVTCEGITNITSADIAAAQTEGFRYKLIATIEQTANGVTASVAPQKLPLSDPLAGVSGPVNAVSFQCDLLGETAIVGPGAGKMATGFALLKDLIDIARCNEKK
ncbi:hypothetical protein BVX97_05615 [bacterium E08(2017)]|nr:hypothetical protein BVX97_05615 [bacterium E08(2017)]